MTSKGEGKWSVIPIFVSSFGGTRPKSFPRQHCADAMRCSSAPEMSYVNANKKVFNTCRIVEQSTVCVCICVRDTYIESEN